MHALPPAARQTAAAPACTRCRLHAFCRASCSALAAGRVLLACCFVLPAVHVLPAMLPSAGRMLRAICRRLAVSDARATADIHRVAVVTKIRIIGKRFLCASSWVGCCLRKTHCGSTRWLKCLEWSDGPFRSCMACLAGLGSTYRYEKPSADPRGR